jgi:serine/threonine protein kinase
MSLTPGTRLGPYEVVAPLGAGGMGEVYLANDTRLDREVAIKVLPREVLSDPERLARFEREAKAVSALNHPNIVTLYEVGSSEFGPFLVLEKIDGQSMRAVIAEGPLPVRRLLAFGAQIATGLAKAHAAGIVHRDLKPDNVMVTGDGFVKILDFGLARLVLPDGGSGEVPDATTIAQQTTSGLVLGTLGYLSPEQASGKPADFRADQFALGALLYEMATGVRPFRRETTLESLAATIRDEPEPIRSRRPDVPAPLAWIVERCLSKSPDDRYASTRDLARDLSDLRDRASSIEMAADVVIAASKRGTRTGLWLGLAALTAAAIALTSYRVGQLNVESDTQPSYRPLTFQRGIATGARFSADGKTIYYSMAVGAEASRVFMTRIDGTESKVLDLPHGFLLSVSAKDDLGVLLTEGLNLGTSLGTLVRVPAIGGEPGTLMVDALFADFAAHGDEFVAINAKQMEFPIGRPMSLNPRPFWARLSPSGDRIATVSNRASSSRLEVIDRNGTSLMSQSEGLIYGLAWSPDGSEVWYSASASKFGADRAVYAVTLAGERRLVARIPGAMTVYDVGPEGKSALVATGASWSSIQAMRQGQSGEQSLDHLGRSQPVGLSADGESVLINEEREVGTGAVLKSTDGRKMFDLGREQPLALRPDGKLVLMVDRKNAARVQLVPTAAGVREFGAAKDLALPKGLEVGGPNRWSRDGRRLFMCLRPDENSACRIWMRDGEQPWRVVTPEIQDPAFAVRGDGEMLAARDSSKTLCLFPVSGGPPTRVEGEVRPPVVWTSDGRELILRDPPSVLPIPARLYRHDLRSGRTTPWRDLVPADRTGVTSVGLVLFSDDLQTVVYQYYRATNELFLAQGLR